MAINKLGALRVYILERPCAEALTSSTKVAITPVAGTMAEVGPDRIS